MNRALLTQVLLGAATALPTSAQEPGAPTEVESVQDLVKLVKEREKAVKSVSLTMRTAGSYPGDAGFETTGTLRVLGALHFHSSMRVEFGDGMASEFETVKTPDGVVMRESDPAQGEIFVKLDKDLLAELEAASRVLGQGDGLIGPDSDRAAGPLGSVMLEDLSSQFELEVTGPRDIDGVACWTVSGPRRADLPDDQAAFGPVDQVDVVVRQGDLAVIRMTQLAAGRPVVRVEITSLELDAPMQPESFALAIPDKARVVSALEHPPARAQIERIFAEAEAKGWLRGQAAAEEPKDKDGETTGR